MDLFIKIFYFIFAIFTFVYFIILSKDVVRGLNKDREVEKK